MEKKAHKIDILHMCSVFLCLCARRSVVYKAGAAQMLFRLIGRDRHVKLHPERISTEVTLVQFVKLPGYILKTSYLSSYKIGVSRTPNALRSDVSPRKTLGALCVFLTPEGCLVSLRACSSTCRCTLCWEKVRRAGTEIGLLGGEFRQPHREPWRPPGWYR